MSYTLTLQDIAQVTPDTYQLTFNRPEDFTFEAGQATELAIQKDGIRDEGRPFTMTSRPNDPHLEFVIKSYPDHDGVTAKVPDLAMTDQVIASEPFGAITDHGTGVFIAGGAGVTPFVSILRTQQQKGEGTSKLIFANKTPEDIILKETWQSMANVDETFVVSEGDVPEARQGQVNKAMLEELVADKEQPFYICGPGEMVNDVRDALKDMGVKKENIITEEGW
ncbi:flavodoxin reductase [Yoonia litorea]|uniref:Ferredoxin-NADP reductase n=1 Tax=Yoonia litorea TaxID=1123755 RepID=A0A1I6MUS9_9RHOB|nr:flavodoxin reductase [Yoonia litorea]SFS19473.1 Ferredoxin-NADP reductase [Yoonia litorea]